jgi:hypothetical protein
MNRKTLLLTAAILLSGSMAFAQATTESLVADYQAQGFTRIEVRNGPTQTRIEAIRGTEKVEVTIDRATGQVLKREVERVGVFENTAPGITVRERDRDFVRLVRADDDDSDDDDDRDDNDRDDENDDDDDRGRGDDDDDDGDDDSSGNRGGSDDDDDDDNGGDRDNDDDSDDDSDDDDDDDGDDD